MTDDFDKPIEPWEAEDMRRLRQGLLDRPLGGSMTAEPAPEPSPARRGMSMAAELRRMLGADADDQG